MSVPSSVGFVDALRRSGVPVSVASSLLFVRALALVSIADPDDVYWSARSSLIHAPKDIDPFNEVFVAYWGRSTKRATQGPSEDPRSVTIGLDDQSKVSEDAAFELSDEDVVCLRYSSIEVLGSKDFADYTETELAQSVALMARIKFDGAQRHSRHHRKATSGQFDMRQTVRHALRTGGEPLKIHKSRPVTRPRRLVLLLDVSGSMEAYSRALIRFMHSAVVGRRNVEVFAIGTRLTRLTRELSSRDTNRAIQAARNAAADWSSGTRLGDALSHFNNEWGNRGVARGAVVLILSDGWDQGDPDQMTEQMERLHRLAHRVLWANPLKASVGYQPIAAGMAAAMPHIDEFLEGHSIDSLEKLAEVLLADLDRLPKPVRVSPSARVPRGAELVLSAFSPCSSLTTPTARDPSGT